MHAALLSSKKPLPGQHSISGICTSQACPHPARMHVRCILLQTKAVLHAMSTGSHQNVAALAGTQLGCQFCSASGTVAAGGAKPDHHWHCFWERCQAVLKQDLLLLVSLISATTRARSYCLSADFVDRVFRLRKLSDSGL